MVPTSLGFSEVRFPSLVVRLATNPRVLVQVPNVGPVVLTPLPLTPPVLVGAAVTAVTGIPKRRLVNIYPLVLVNVNILPSDPARLAPLGRKIKGPLPSTIALVDGPVTQSLMVA